MLQKRNRMQLKDKNIIIVGLARSGAGAANLLAELGASVTVTDMKSEDELADATSRLLPSVMLVLGGHPEDIFMSADMIVLSPGVPLDIKPLASAKARGVKIIGELELAYQIIVSTEYRVQSTGSENQIPFLAVTGSNGKSTTTTLLDFMMRKGGFKAMLGGNIGNALTEEILKEVNSEKLKVKSEETNLEVGSKSENLSPFTFHLSQDFIVAEVSSFQLEAIDKFRPHIASILNITPDHLDRYHSMSEYSDAKAKIFFNQQANDFLVLNADDTETIKVQSTKYKVQSNKPKVFYFSRKKEVEGVYLKDGIICSNFPNLACRQAGSERYFPLINADEVKIKGVHNLENAMAASAMALLANCPVEAVIDSLREFKGLEHRLEFVRELDGVRYFNDSKGTNVGAVIKSIESFQEPLILIAGGRDKAGEFSALREVVKERVKTLILIGEAAGEIRDALGDVSDTIMAKDMEDAVKKSHDIARKGNVVLLSPACASFDMFRDFEDRGRQFKQNVMELEKQYA